MSTRRTGDPAAGSFFALLLPPDCNVAARAVGTVARTRR
jgi:hypothetical protein